MGRGAGRHPALVGMARQLLGPKICCWEIDCFAKAPDTPSYISWHQDITYWGVDADRIVTAWLALTPSTLASGCVRVVPGSHLLDAVEHVEGSDQDNMLSRRQEIAVSVDERDAVALELRPGEISFHHVKMFHASAPNRSTWPRIGIAVRYAATDVRLTHSYGDFATAVDDASAGGSFTLVASAKTPLGQDEVARHAEVNAHRARINAM